MKLQRSAASITLAAALAVAGVPALSAEARGGERPPNFVVMFIDDMGYGDIGPFGSKKNSTPHLDRMAAEGMKLTSFYVASPVCTPSRAALMTGCYPQRVGLNRGPGHIVLFPGDGSGLNPSEITMAESGTSATSPASSRPIRGSTPTTAFPTRTTCGRASSAGRSRTCRSSKARRSSTSSRTWTTRPTSAGSSPRRPSSS